jgi:hypothetical protein
VVVLPLLVENGKVTKIFGIRPMGSDAFFFTGYPERCICNDPFTKARQKWNCPGEHVAMNFCGQAN